MRRHRRSRRNPAAGTKVEYDSKVGLTITPKTLMIALGGVGLLGVGYLAYLAIVGANAQAQLAELNDADSPSAPPQAGQLGQGGTNATGGIVGPAAVTEGTLPYNPYTGAGGA